MATRGFAAPEVGRAYLRAQELCEQLGETPQRFAVLRGLRRVYFARGEVPMMKAVAAEQLRLAEQSADPLLLAEARTAVGFAAAYDGDLAAARANLEQGTALYGSGQPRASAVTVGEDPGVTCGAHMAIVLWLLGSPAQALQQAQQAHRLAERLGHPFGLAYTLDHLALLHLLRGEWGAVQECAQAASGLATAQGFRFFQAHAMLLTGRALAAQGETAPGLAQMRQGLAGIEATGQIQGMVMTLSGGGGPEGPGCSPGPRTYPWVTRVRSRGLSAAGSTPAGAAWAGADAPSHARRGSGSLFPAGIGAGS
jgi:tetratricopeptide (TPR) repeat protein